MTVKLPIYVVVWPKRAIGTSSREGSIVKAAAVWWIDEPDRTEELDIVETGAHSYVRILVITAKTVGII